MQWLQSHCQDPKYIGTTDVMGMHVTAPMVQPLFRKQFPISDGGDVHACDSDDGYDVFA